jgi:serine/threonine protein kinase
MGEVYTARDTRLDRMVAVKVLPEHIAMRVESRARFEREARAVASLQHPNICSLFDIGPGYMVMELIEGETVAARIEKGAIPLEQGLRYAIQIADALDRAHRAGVTHRDVKPQNIMLTRDGVKVLDFGLAKSSVSKPGPTEATLTKVLTTEGTVAGTPQYMAPEQFEGKEADARSDIWAFGAVLYEMVTGQKAFQGKSYSSLVGAILSADPAPMAATQVTPAWLERLVRRCLAKDPEERYQSMRDVVLDLRTPPPEIIAAAPAKTGWWPWVAGVASLALLGASAAYWLRSVPGKDTAAPLLQFSFTQPGMAERPYARLSPDGRWLAFVAGDRLWLRNMETGQAKPIEGTSGAQGPFWSPDSTTLAYIAQSQVWKVGVNGAAPVALARVRSAGAGCFSLDGKTALVHAGKVGYMAIPLEGGAPRVAWKEPEQFGRTEDFGGCTVLPQDGPMRWVLLSMGRKLILVDLQSATPQEIGVGAMPVYSPAGYLVFLNGDRIQAAPFSLQEKKITGAPIDLASNGAEPDLSSTGLLTFAGSGSAETRLAIRDRKGGMLGTAGATQHRMSELSVSPDGRRIAVRSAEQGSADIWLHETDRAVKTRLTTSEGPELRPQWSPDGNQIVYNTDGSLEVVPADGSRPPEKILASHAVSDWSPDGRSILHWMITPVNNTSFSTRSGPGAPWQTTPYLMGRFNQSFAKFSRDGRFVAYVSDESGEYEVYVRPFPSGPGKWRVTPKGGVQPRWSRDGKEIFYLDNGVLMAVPFSVKGDTFTPGTPQVLFDTGAHGSGRTNWKYDELPGGRFVVIERVAEALAEARTIHVVSNWPALLERKSVGKE